MHRTAATSLLACLALTTCNPHARAPTLAPAPARAATPEALCPSQAPGTSDRAVDRMREAILRGLALTPGMFVGDIGTGGGWFTVRVASTIGKTGKVIGTDIDEATIAGLRSAPPLSRDSAPIELRVVTGPRDAGLADLPPNHLDLLLLIDSLCFDGRTPRATDLAYLRQFLRVLKPGGRLVHHMDCTCRTTVAEVEALFIDAGFAGQIGHVPLTCAEVSTEGCQGAEAQARARFVGVFAKPR